jgi:hypothetical protein
LDRVVVVPAFSSRHVSWALAILMPAMSIRTGAAVSPAPTFDLSLAAPSLSAAPPARSAMLSVPSLRFTSVALRPSTSMRCTCTCFDSSGITATATRAASSARNPSLPPGSDSVRRPSLMPTSGHTDSSSGPAMSSLRCFCSITTRVSSALSFSPSNSA